MLFYDLIYTVKEKESPIVKVKVETYFTKDMLILDLERIKALPEFREVLSIQTSNIAIQPHNTSATNFFKP